MCVRAVLVCVLCLCVHAPAQVPVHTSHSVMELVSHANKDGVLGQSCHSSASAWLLSDFPSVVFPRLEKYVRSSTSRHGQMEEAVCPRAFLPIPATGVGSTWELLSQRAAWLL